MSIKTIINRVAGLGIMAIMAVSIASCGSKEKVVTNDDRIKGTWHTERAELQADIIVTFNVKHEFILRQRIGESRYEQFTGTWKFDGDLLSGAYNCNTDEKHPSTDVNINLWASDYKVEFSPDLLQMTWTSTLDPNEVDVYTRVVTE